MKSVDFEKAQWDLEIKPKNNWFDLNLKDLWRYRDLLVLLIKRDFVSVYKQTLLGPWWMLIQPIFTTIAFTFVFGNLAGISTDGLPKPLFYLAGLTAWNYFAACFTNTSSIFTGNAAIFSKVYFPRLIIPLSVVASNIIKLAVQMLLFLGLLFWYGLGNCGFHVQWSLLLFPLLVVLLAMMGLGFGLLITALTTKYRDFTFMIGFGVQLLMYATPIIYPLSSVHGKYREMLELNPISGIIETFRHSFLGKGEFSVYSLCFSALFSIAVLFAGVLLFTRAEKNFVDTV
jgi:lipopolysaccharide transport system permease protein